LLAQLPKHSKEGLPIRAGHAHPCPTERCRVVLAWYDAQEFPEPGELTLPGAAEDRNEQFVSGAKVIQQHARGYSRCLHKWLKTVRKAKRQSMVGAPIEELVGDVRLRVSSHALIFSRNERYVYR
jgi:hypothetical protein